MINTQKVAEAFVAAWQASDTDTLTELATDNLYLQWRGT